MGGPKKRRTSRSIASAMTCDGPRRRALPTLAEYLLPFARPGGRCIAMKGSDAQTEVDQAAGAMSKLGGEVSRVETVSLPGRDDRRALIVISKRHPTPKLYPRQGGAPRKSPLI